MNTGDIFEGDPKIVTGGKYFKPRSDPLIGVGQRFEFFAIELAFHWFGVRGEREALLFEHVLPGAFGIECAAIKQRTQHRIFARTLQQIKLLVDAFVFAREAEQFEKKRPGFIVGRILAEVFIQGRNRFGELPGLD